MQLDLFFFGSVIAACFAAAMLVRFAMFSYASAPRSRIERELPSVAAEINLPITARVQPVRYARTAHASTPVAAR